MKQRDRAVITFALGMLLILNPVYLFPGGVPGEKTYTYDAERVESHSEFDNAVRASAVVDCSDGVRHYECVLLRQVGYDGTLRVANETSVHLSDDEHGLFFEYDYVRFDDGYALPNATVENGTLVLSTEPRSRSRVRDEYAVAYESLPAVGKRAIDDGSASITKWVQLGENVDPVVSAGDRFVERNGTYYAIYRYPGEWWRPVPDWVLTLVRIVGVVGGGALAFVGASRHARIVDS